MSGTWRDIARPIISKVIAENKGEDIKRIKKALFHAYPFGQRKYHPYKIWLDEIKKQLPKTEPYKTPPNQISMWSKND